MAKIPLLQRGSILALVNKMLEDMGKSWIPMILMPNPSHWEHFPDRNVMKTTKAGGGKRQECNLQQPHLAFLKTTIPTKHAAENHLESIQI